MTTPNDDALMQEALALLGQEPPMVIEPDSLEAAFDAEEPADEITPAPLRPPAAPLTIGPPSAASPTLAALEASRHPQQKTACETCPNSVWFSSPEEVKCYCRVMYLVAWSSQAPNQITHCDGLYLGQEEA